MKYVRKILFILCLVFALMYSGEAFAVAELILPNGENYYSDGVMLEDNTLYSLPTDGNRVIIRNIDSSGYSYGVDMIISTNIPSSVDSVRLSFINSPDEIEYTGLIIGKTKSYPVINGISQPYFLINPSEPFLLSLYLKENEEGYMLEISVNSELKAEYQVNSSLDRYSYVRLDALGASSFIMYSELLEDDMEPLNEPDVEDNTSEESSEEEPMVEEEVEEPFMEEEPIIEEEIEEEANTEEEDLTVIDSPSEEEASDSEENVENGTATQDEENSLSNEENIVNVSAAEESGGDNSGEIYENNISNLSNVTVIIGIAASSVFLTAMWLALRSKMNV